MGKAAATTQSTLDAVQIALVSWDGLQGGGAGDSLLGNAWGQSTFRWNPRSRFYTVEMSDHFDTSPVGDDYFRVFRFH